MIEDYDYWLNLVTDYGVTLSSIPVEFRDYNLCLAAVTDYSWALKYVPDELRTFELLITIPILHAYKDYINWDILDQSQQEFLRLKYGL